jgi:hypothetical protein
VSEMTRLIGTFAREASDVGYKPGYLQGLRAAAEPIEAYCDARAVIDEIERKEREL